MSTRTSILLASAVMVIGLLLGPVYSIYYGFFSGSKAGVYPVEVGQPVMLGLSPKMNPVRLEMAAMPSRGRLQRHGTPSRHYSRETYYVAVLLKDTQILWKERFRVILDKASNPAAADTSPIRTFSVDQPGEYTLTIRHDPRSSSRPGYELYVHVVRNVVETNPFIGMLGFFLLLAGGGWLLVTAAIAQHAARTGRSVSPKTPVPSIHHRRKRPQRPVTKRRKQPTGPIPYDIHRRPLPSGNDLNTLLPIEVGPFRREPFDETDEPEAVGGEPIYVEYRSDEGEVFVELGICRDAEEARRAVDVAQGEASEPGAVEEFSPKTEPSFYRMVAPSGAFMAWSRENYYFSASVRSRHGKEILDRFMNAFPY